MAARGKGVAANAEVLSVNELDGLREERQDLERSLREGEGFGTGTAGEAIDKVAMQRRIHSIGQQIIDGTPGKMTGKQIDSLSRESKELEAQFKKGMPTRYEMAHPGKCPGAVRKHMKWLNENEKTGYVDRYRTIQRILNPGEEHSIETLRKDK